MGTTPFAIAPNSSGIMMVSVVVPARAIAGTYVLDVAVGLQVRDSVIVRVPRRQALEVTLVDKPGYVVSGQPYEARFVVRNRGNFPARVRVRARSTLGRASLRDTTLRVDTVATCIETERSTFGPFCCNRYGLAWIVDGGGTTWLDQNDHTAFMGRHRSPAGGMWLDLWTG